MGRMETRRWVNQSQPQTLYMGTILLYINAVFGIIWPSVLALQLGQALGLLGLVGMGAAGYGFANERKWGYKLGVAVVGLEVAILAMWLALDFRLLFDLGFIFAALWPGVLMALLLHPQSREYQKIWFK